METSHKRLTMDLEQKHKMEIERLLAEKETALAEETQVQLIARQSTFVWILNFFGFIYYIYRPLWLLWTR